jgi:N-acetylmuramoyl-L-alanine amidase
MARARALAAGEAPLPQAAEARAIAELIEMRADREGAGARAVELRVVAAGLLERLWRVEGREQDGREAVAQYRAAALAMREGGACEAALRAARVSGDLSHDAESAYAELYRAKRRFGTTNESCSRRADEMLSLLAAFRPPQRTLDAIDEALASEGVAPAVAPQAPPETPAGPPQIARIEAWPSADAARVVVVLNRPSAYRVSDEVAPGANLVRTFVDLDGVDPGAAPHDVPGKGIVTRIRAAATTTGSRVVLDLDGRAWRRVFALQDPFRIVLDVARHPPGVQGRNPRRVTRVVLDPGHGGKDVGAAGTNGTREKEVTLDIAHRVAPILAAQGIQVVLTRDDDRFVSLEERTARANAFGADLFVSIHCNASESRTPRGVETYVLEPTRDELAARVAARENATTQAATAELASILGGMRVADEAARSVRFARLLQRASVVALRLRYDDVVDGGVHTAGFYVLVGARMPSVLFEASYLSNPGDEQRLGSDEGRQLFADAVVNAVRAYREGR